MKRTGEWSLGLRLMWGCNNNYLPLFHDPGSKVDQGCHQTLLLAVCCPQRPLLPWSTLAAQGRVPAMPGTTHRKGLALSPDPPKNGGRGEPGIFVP